MSDATNSNGQFMGGNVNAPPVEPAPPPSMYGIPPSGYPVQIQGTGGYVSKGAQFISGMQAGSQLVGDLQNSQRARQQYQDTRNAQIGQQIEMENLRRKAKGQAQLPMPGDPGYSPDELTGAHPGIVDSVVEGAKGLIGKLFGSQPQSSGPGAGPSLPQPVNPNQAPGEVPGVMSRVQAIPPPSQVPQNGPNGQGSPAAMQAGGEVTPLPFLARPAPGTMGVETSHQALPGVSGYADGGPVQIQGTGGYVSPGAQLISGVQAGQQIAGDAIDASRAGAQYDATQAARQALAQHIESNFAMKLSDAKLNDEGVPGGQQGIPAPSVPPGTAPESAAAAKAASIAASDPNAQQGVPQQSPAQSGKPHSLTPDFWNDVNDQAVHAAALAARAGQDPNQVYHSLIALRNTFFQGEVLKNLSAANQALIAGDMPSVEKALRNTYYYLPDGQDLKLRHGADGTLQYQDPINPFLDKDSKPTQANTGKPNYVDVTAQHLQLIGQAALDPMTVATTLQQYRMQPFNMRLQAMKAQSELTTAQGTLLRGEGIADEGKARLGTVATTNVKNLSEAQLDQARAQTAGYALLRWQMRAQQLRLDPTALRGAQQAGQSVEDTVMGRTAMPITDKDGNLSLNPRAGQMGYDRTTAPKEFQSMTPLELGEAKALAGDIYMTNARVGMTPQSAAQTALRMQQAKGKTHRGPKGEVHPNAYVDRQSGSAGLWNPRTGRYDVFQIGQQSVSGLLDRGGAMPEDQFISSGLGGASPQRSSGANPAAAPDNEIDNSSD